MINKPHLDLRQAREIIGQSTQICLFGIGTLFFECYDQIVGLVGRKPNYLCDNDPQKWGQIFFGISCLPPKSLVNATSNLPPKSLVNATSNTLIIITIKNHKTIQAQLVALGFSNILYVQYERDYNIAQSILNTTSNKPAKNNTYFDTISLKGRWALVTGASRGIGFLTAKELGRLGCNIIAHARTLKGLEKLENELADLPIQVKTIAADLMISEELENFLKRILKGYPPIDIIYNNAGSSPACPSDFWSIPEKHYLNAYRVNTLAPIKICTTLLPGMIERGFGRIVNLTSSILKRPAEMAYACSKAALDKFVFDLAPSLNGTGVMISLADPGWLRTDMGGQDAPLPVASVLPGILLGALLSSNINGRWISAQDYTGLSIKDALHKTNFTYSFTEQ